MLCNPVLFFNNQEEILNFLLNDGSDDLLVIWNEQNEIILATDKIKQFFTTQPFNLSSGTWHQLFPDEITDLIEKHFQTLNEPLQLNEVEITDQAGNVHIMEGKVKKSYFRNNAFYLCSFKDITEQVLLKKKLINIEKSVLTSYLSAGLIHEIRNPLTSLKGFLQLIEAGIHKQEKYCQVLINEIEKIEDITKELLQIATPTKKPKQVEYVHELIEDVILIMQTQQKMRNIDFIFNKSGNFSIYCHPNEIKQVMINIVKNAAEAMNFDGRIWIDLNSDDKYVYIKIIDEGPGIPEHLIAEVQTPFYTTKEDGTGLGLVVSKQIIEDHQGTLTIDTSGTKGCTFIITLPKHQLH